MHMRQIGEIVNKEPATHDDKPNPLKAGTESQGASTADQNVGPDMPKLLLTLKGRVLQEFEVKESKVLIGRARLNDLVIRNQYVSKYHKTVAHMRRVITNKILRISPANRQRSN